MGEGGGDLLRGELDRVVLEDYIKLSKTKFCVNDILKDTVKFIVYNQ